MLYFFCFAAALSAARLASGDIGGSEEAGNSGGGAGAGAGGGAGAGAAAAVFFARGDVIRCAAAAANGAGAGAFAVLLMLLLLLLAVIVLELAAAAAGPGLLGVVVAGFTGVLLRLVPFAAAAVGVRAAAGVRGFAAEEDDVEGDDGACRGEAGAGAEAPLLSMLGVNESGLGPSGGTPRLVEGLPLSTTGFVAAGFVGVAPPEPPFACAAGALAMLCIEPRPAGAAATRGLLVARSAAAAVRAGDLGGTRGELVVGGSRGEEV